MKTVARGKFTRRHPLCGMLFGLIVVAWNHAQLPAEDAADRIDVHFKAELVVPEAKRLSPAAGRRVIVTPPEYRGTEVFHTLYLPADWTADGERLPIIFEYTGNQFEASGSTGEPEDAALGYGLSAGRYIWVSLPYINAERNDNAVRWWGDEDATIAYAKRYVPQIITEYHADPDAVFLCGFSRGAIAVNYLGLHDDEIAGLWTAFISHDHFDGVRQWPGTTWGSPLADYRQQASERLRRVAGRPYWVSQNGSTEATQQLIRSVLGAEAVGHTGNFQCSPVNTREILGAFPNRTAKSSHTDRWLLKSSSERTRLWQWMNSVAGH